MHRYKDILRTRTFMICHFLFSLEDCQPTYLARDWWFELGESNGKGPSCLRLLQRTTLRPFNSSSLDVDMGKKENYQLRGLEFRA